MTGWQEILLVLIGILILFGAKKLPDLARALGKSLGEFKKGKAEGEMGDKAENTMNPEKDEGAEDKNSRSFRMRS